MKELILILRNKKEQCDIEYLGLGFKVCYMLEKNDTIALMHYSGIITKEVLKIAMENTVKNFPIVIKVLDGIELKEVTFDNLSDTNLLTNKYVNCGSICIFYPGALEKFSEAFGTDVIFCFTSKHESVVHPFGKIPVEKIKENIKEAIETINDPEIYLTDNVYVYHRESGKIEVV